MTRKTPNPDDQVALVGREMRNGTWLANAQVRARRRKSAWNLLLPLLGFPLWFGVGLLLGWSAMRLHTWLHPAAAPLFGSGPLDLDTALVMFPVIFASLCPAFLLTNVLVYLIPPARRAMDAEDRDWPGLGYANSQRALLKVALWAGAICLPVMLLGVLLP